VLFALWLPAGLCLRAGSRVWRMVGILLILPCGFAVLGCFPYFKTVSVLGHVQIFDRMMLLPSWQYRMGCLVQFLLSVALVNLLIWDKKRAQPKTPVKVLAV